MRKTHLLLSAVCVALLSGCSADMSSDEQQGHLKHAYLFHLVQAELWEAAVNAESEYFPPTYDQDGFTHATANTELLLNVANHFYQDVPGQWLCLRMTVDSLRAVGTKVVFEGTAPVGDKEADFAGTDDELFPHILGGINPSAVLKVHEVTRAEDGTFLVVAGVTSGN